MAAECLASIHLCRIRVTRLNALGNLTAGPNNSYVSDKPISLGVTPNIETGSDTVLKGGCDTIVAQKKGDDLLKRFDLQLDLGALEPALVEMLTGGAAILAGADPIGVWWPLGTTVAPKVAFEGWSDAWEDDHQFTALPYVHWIFPATKWQVGPVTLQNDFATPQLNGASVGNPNFGLGPYLDLPEAAHSNGGYFYSATTPAAGCGYKSVAIT